MVLLTLIWVAAIWPFGSGAKKLFQISANISHSRNRYFADAASDMFMSIISCREPKDVQHGGSPKDGNMGKWVGL